MSSAPAASEARLAKKKKPASKAFMAGTAVACVLVGLWSIYQGWQGDLLSRAGVASRCSVVASRIAQSSSSQESKGPAKSWAEATLEHEVGGKVYRRVDEGPHVPISSDAAKDVPKVGARLPCNYVEGHPELVTIFAHERNTVGWRVFGVFALLLPIIFYVIERRKGFRWRAR